MSRQGLGISFASARYPEDLAPGTEREQNISSHSHTGLPSPLTIVYRRHSVEEGLGYARTLFGMGRLRGMPPYSGKSMVTLCGIFQSPDIMALPPTVLWGHLPQLSMFGEHGFNFNTKLSKTMIEKVILLQTGNFL